MFLAPLILFGRGEGKKEAIKTMDQINLDNLQKPSIGGELDARNQGLNRIYFYLRKHDNFLFALDKELQASHLHRQKQFKEMYHYLGWTDGREYNEKVNQIQREIRDQVRKEVSEAKLSSEAAKEYEYKRTTELTRERDGDIFEALKEEAKKAQSNPQSSSTPRNFRNIDLDGNPQSGGIWDMVKMMR